ncbi:MAG: OmpA family protein [Oligoflexia bacterium]|nr:OmpA family protein [Oligoflexia bacterium]
MKIVLLLAAVLPLIANANKQEDAIAVGGVLGMAIEAPWAHDTYKNAVGPGPRLGAFIRFNQVTPRPTFEISPDYLTQSTQKIESKSLIASMLWRLFPDHKLHPVWGFGFGFTALDNFFLSRDKTLAIFRLHAGIDYEIKKNLEIGFHLDHFSVMKNFANEPNMHVLAPSIAAIFYFGASSPEGSVGESTHITKAAPNSAVTDTDGDGVNDNLDKCPNTPKGASVNEQGCAKKQTYTIRLDVKFENNAARIRSAEMPDIQDLANVMKRNPDVKIELQGHTDNIGSKARNTKLSIERAVAVKNILTKRFSISANRIKANGYGPSQPIATNSTEEGRAQNRRVTVVILH